MTEPFLQYFVVIKASFLVQLFHLLFPQPLILPFQQGTIGPCKLRGGQGGLNFPLPHLVLPVLAPFLCSSRLYVLFLLRNIAQCCEIHFLFLPTPAPLGIPSPALSSPASSTIPAPITPEFPTSCPPPQVTCRRCGLLNSMEITCCFSSQLTGSRSSTSPCVLALKNVQKDNLTLCSSSQGFAVVKGQNVLK